MNNKLEIAFGKHIVRLEKDVAEAQTRIDEHNLGNDGMEAQLIRDDLKKVALLREAVVPKYSDLPEGKYGNNLPAIEMFEFADITDLNAAATHDLDLIDYGKELGKEVGRLTSVYEQKEELRKAVNKKHGLG